MKLISLCIFLVVVLLMVLGCHSLGSFGVDRTDVATPIRQSAESITSKAEAVDGEAGAIERETAEPQTKARAQVIRVHAGDIKAEAGKVKAASVDVAAMQNEIDSLNQQLADAKSEGQKQTLWLFRIFAGIGAACIPAGLMIGFLVKRWDFGIAVAGGGAVLMGLSLFVMVALQWLILGFGVLMILAIGYAAYLIFTHRRAIGEVVKSVELSGVKESVKREARKVQSKATRALVHAVK